jgi:hypothetical protein
MKLVQVGSAHARNTEFIVRACRSFSIEYHFVQSPEEIRQVYDIIWSPAKWIDPDLHPTSKFIFGPHFWVFPDAHDPLFTASKPEHSERCFYNCLSEWNKQVHSEAIQAPCIPFVALPFGIEKSPALPKSEYQYDCIVYYKRRNPKILEFCMNELVKRGFRTRLFHYGSYHREEYMETLRRTKFVVWIGSHESQGFGLEECLATNTPIYLYDVKSMHEEYDRDHYVYTGNPNPLFATTAPYWSPFCGIKVYSNEEFATRMDEFLKALPTYRPATYVQSTLTDTVCFNRFLQALHIRL